MNFNNYVSYRFIILKTLRNKDCPLVLHFRRFWNAIFRILCKIANYKLVDCTHKSSDQIATEFPYSKLDTDF